MIENREKLINAGIDLDDALERFDYQNDLYEKYLLRFQEDKHMSAVKQGMENLDYDFVLREAHAMKGLTGTLGMQNLYEACSAVVSAVRENHTEELPGLVDDMETQYIRIMSIYKA